MVQSNVIKSQICCHACVTPKFTFRIFDFVLFFVWAKLFIFLFSFIGSVSSMFIWYAKRRRSAYIYIYVSTLPTNKEYFLIFWWDSFCHITMRLISIDNSIANQIATPHHSVIIIWYDMWPQNLNIHVQISITWHFWEPGDIWFIHFFFCCPIGILFSWDFWFLFRLSHTLATPLALHCFLTCTITICLSIFVRKKNKKKKKCCITGIGYQLVWLLLVFYCHSQHSD